MKTLFKLRNSIKNLCSRLSLFLFKIFASSKLIQILWILLFVFLGFLVSIVIYCAFVDHQFDLKAIFLNVSSLFVNKDFCNEANTIVSFAIFIIGYFLIYVLLVSFVVNFIFKKTEAFNNGEKKFYLNKHIVILGYNNSVPSLIKKIINNRDQYGKPKILLQSSHDINSLRIKLRTKLNKAEEKRLIFYSASRDSEEDLRDMNIEFSSIVFCIGEGEKDCDFINLNSVKKISSIFSSSKFKNDKLKCFTLIESKSINKLLKRNNITEDVSNNINFCPFSINEIWARKLFIVNNACLNDSDSSIIRYQPLDRDGITRESEVRVHLVIIGMTNMGITLALEALKIAHFPNFKTKNIKSKISFIDINIDFEMNCFMNEHKQLFENTTYRYFDINNNSRNKSFLIPLKEDHSRYRATDFEFDFYNANIANPKMQDVIDSWANDTNQYLTIVSCLNNPTANISVGYNFSDLLYKNNIPIYILQKAWGELYDFINDSKYLFSNYKYSNVKPFGMDFNGIDSSIDFKNWGRYVNFFYKKSYISTNTKEINELWNDATYIEKWFSIYHAMSIPTKLRSIGINLVFDSFGSFNISSNLSLFSLKINDIELLNYVEDNRWNIEFLLSDIDEKYLFNSSNCNIIDHDKNECSRSKYVFKYEKFIYYFVEILKLKSKTEGLDVLKDILESK